MDFSIISSTIGNKFWSSPDILSENNNIDINLTTKIFKSTLFDSVISSNDSYIKTLSKLTNRYYFSEMKENQANTIKTFSFVFNTEVGKFLTYSSVNKIDDKFRSLLLVDKLSRYKENWDGYGAKPFSLEFIDFLNKLVLSLEKPVLISPVGSPSVIFSYSKANIKLLFEVHETYYHYVIKQKDGKKSNILKSGVNKRNDIQEINNVIKDFFNEY